ncbi:tRNA (guanosine(37)-N1)-methyltransferase TrmD [Patescibacteria group bacterium]|nr:tRNA (guanosine(37)-N1)-methyltransferase TrmD [Patescibacteria group bacterium]MBU1934155.1 tRNA (guanosine(37)-N1)-methyltransferase TrmD [Patescibacteria group bacterium]MBU2007529.1 tRNA (guanosine(37)-N1)-methyltransferase TrmD [Patescibacteria group bacterium]MBU2233960.1 tRNA (guanosine(37)-N1)-methyltransferase TrmD [Patescibacteria group bacterium]MBU2264428.1 tRNA (guanosine(37)-N1)-methyltransferase TrmD [Patescibacteria group bacterium]
MTFHIITIFPKIFDSYFNESILKRAVKNNLINIKIYNLRDWTTDKHKTVDDSPFGGGAGMVMKIEPLCRAVESIKHDVLRDEKNSQNTKYKIQNTKTILLSAKGKTLNQQKVKKLTKYKNLILICGRYEGVDERITKFIDEEISIGNYILTGGEIGAMTIVDSITRLLPGALGNADSAQFESHSTPGILEYPQYTRPEIFTARLFQKRKSYRVPKVLLSGDHKKIAAWRKKHGTVAQCSFG